MRMDDADPFEVLDLDEGASKAEIQLALAWALKAKAHPTDVVAHAHKRLQQGEALAWAKFLRARLPEARRWRPLAEGGSPPPRPALPSLALLEDAHQRWAWWQADRAEREALAREMGGEA